MPVHHSLPEPNTQPLPPPRPRRDLQALLFLTLFFTYGYFWQSRDWNTASRLMLTYALVDRGTLHIDGLQIHAGDPAKRAGDLAFARDHYYTEKAPGQSLVGVPAYALWKGLTGSPGHPLNLRKAESYWPQDFWVTWGTSGLATALIGLLVYRIGLRLGATHADAVLLALAYGLGTHALVYATLFYGHQTAAFALLWAFGAVCLSHPQVPAKRNAARLTLAGLAIGCAGVIEMPLLPLAAVLGLAVIVRYRSVALLTCYTLATAAPLLILPCYHAAAFGDPFTTGYHHIINPDVRAVHQGIGLFGLNFRILPELLWLPRRGMFLYAPITAVGLLALLANAWRGQWKVVLIPATALTLLLLVNLSHFYWAGGLATGPRFLLPALPLLIVPIAAWLARLRNRPRALRLLRVSIILAGSLGAAVALTCAFAGGRFGPTNDPVTAAVERVNPLLTEVLPSLGRGHVSCRVLGDWLGDRLPPAVAGLVLFLTIMGLLLAARLRTIDVPTSANPLSPP